MGKEGNGAASPPPQNLGLPNGPPAPPHSLPADHFQWPPQNFGPDGGGGGMEEYIKQEMSNGGGEAQSADYMGHFHSSPGGMMAVTGPPHLQPPPHVHPHQLHQLHHAQAQQHHAHGDVIAAELANTNNPAGQYPPQDNLSHPPWVR